MSQSSTSNKRFNDSEEKERLCHPYAYDFIHDGMFNDLQLLRLVDEPLTRWQEERIMYWFRDPRANESSYVLLLAILIKVDAPQQLIMDGYREMQRLLEAEAQSATCTLPGVDQLSVLGFCFFNQTDPNVIKSMILISGRVHAASISWNNITYDAISMLLEERVRLRIGSSNHDEVLVAMLRGADYQRIDTVLRGWLKSQKGQDDDQFCLFCTCVQFWEFVEEHFEKSNGEEGFHHDYFVYDEATARGRDALMKCKVGCFFVIMHHDLHLVSSHVIRNRNMQKILEHPIYRKVCLMHLQHQRLLNRQEKQRKDFMDKQERERTASERDLESANAIVEQLVANAANDTLDVSSSSNGGRASSSSSGSNRSSRTSSSSSSTTINGGTAVTGNRARANSTESTGSGGKQTRSSRSSTTSGSRTRSSSSSGTRTRSSSNSSRGRTHHPDGATVSSSGSTGSSSRRSNPLPRSSSSSKVKESRSSGSPSMPSNTTKGTTNKIPLTSAPLVPTARTRRKSKTRTRTSSRSRRSTSSGETATTASSSSM